MSGPRGEMIEEPEGLVYRPDVIDPGEEAMLLSMLEALDFRAITMRGQTARRTVRLYGYDYVLAGSARWAWQHSIPPMKALRYSFTFRSLRRR
jgi:alkylated DNA repair dioxygenase AlkB